MKILCATDFTSCADEATRAANAVARQCNALLELVHVSPSVAGIFRTVEEDNFTETATQGAWTRLHKRAESLAALGVPPACKLLTLARGESVPEALVRYTAETSADLLVISTHGKSGSKLWPMGSLATSIVDASAVPVLVIHEAHSLAQWRERHGELLRVLVGLDLTEDSNKVLAVMKQFHLDQGARITAGYVQQLYPMSDSMWQVAPIIPVWTAADDALQEKQLRELMGTHFGNQEVHVKAQSGYATPAHHLVEMAADERCDLLVTGTHQRSGVARLLFGSVSHGVLRESKTNLLFVPLQHPKAAAPTQTAVASALGKHIFCATDFTPRSSEAALTAQELAIRFGSTFEIAHVLEDYISWPGLPDDALNNLKMGALTRLKQFSMDLSARGLSPKKTLIEAKEHEPVADCILEYLKAHRPLLAVISSHGKSAGSWWPLGSTALRIAQDSSVPVLVVKSSEAFQTWLESGKQLHVLGAVDAQGQAAGVLEWMKLLHEAGSCSFTLVHIDQSNGSSAIPSPAGEPVSNVLGSHSVLEKGLMTLARSVLGEQADLSVLVEETWDSVAAKIDETARTSKADLIIVGAHQWHGIKRWFFESVFRELIIKSDASILCLPMPQSRMMQNHPTPAMNHLLLSLCTALALAACRNVSTLPSPDSVPANPKFEQDVKPILQKQCVACHNRQSLPDRWSVENAREANLSRPNVGPMIIPGFPDKSPMIKAITLSYENIHAMPPLSVHASPAEIETLRRWIAQGVEWPEGKAGEIKPPPVKPPY